MREKQALWPQQMRISIIAMHSLLTCVYLSPTKMSETLFQTSHFLINADQLQLCAAIA